jgi:hypothetical protein
LKCNEPNERRGEEMGNSWIAIVLAAMSCLFSPASEAQQAGRPLHVWVDTTRLNVCDGKQFTVAVNIDTIYYRDSLSAFSLVVQWDRAHIDLDPFILDGGTLARLARDRTIQKNPDPSMGEMYIVAGITIL